jgi:hypothetical protein
MTAEVLTKGNQRKFIPILREGDWQDAASNPTIRPLFIRLAAIISVVETLRPSMAWRKVLR